MFYDYGLVATRDRETLGYFAFEYGTSIGSCGDLEVSSFVVDLHFVEERVGLYTKMAADEAFFDWAREFSFVGFEVACYEFSSLLSS